MTCSLFGGQATNYLLKHMHYRKVETNGHTLETTDKIEFDKMTNKIMNFAFIFEMVQQFRNWSVN